MPTPCTAGEPLIPDWSERSSELVDLDLEARSARRSTRRFQGGFALFFEPLSGVRALCNTSGAAALY